MLKKRIASILMCVVMFFTVAPVSMASANQWPYPLGTVVRYTVGPSPYIFVCMEMVTLTRCRAGYVRILHKNQYSSRFGSDTDGFRPAKGYCARTTKRNKCNFNQPDGTWNREGFVKMNNLESGDVWSYR